MFELIVIAVIGIGLYRRRGQRWEWSRARLERAISDLRTDGERTVARTRRSLPQLLDQCLADVRSLVSDTLGVLEPRARKRLERKARSLASRARRHAPTTQPLQAASAGGGVVPGGASIASGAPAAQADPAYRGLQRRYLEGAISLQQYMKEARRLQDEDGSA